MAALCALACSRTVILVLPLPVPDRSSAEGRLIERAESGLADFMRGQNQMLNQLSPSHGQSSNFDIPEFYSS